MQSFAISKNVYNFALQNRKVAQLVAHYVRDVGVGRSSRLFPTLKRGFTQVSLFLFKEGNPWAKCRLFPTLKRGFTQVSFFLFYNELYG